MSTISILKTDQLETPLIEHLVHESLQEGYQFVKKLVSEFTDATNRFDKPGEALYIAMYAEQIVGVCGLNQDPYLQQSNIGRVRHLYVSQPFRQKGIGKLLLLRVIQDARPHFNILTLRTSNPIADHFYRSIGFSTNSPYKEATHFMEL